VKELQVDTPAVHSQREDPDIPPLALGIAS